MGSGMHTVAMWLLVPCEPKWEVTVVTVLDIEATFLPDPCGPLAEHNGNTEDLWSLLFAYGQTMWGGGLEWNWFAGLEASFVPPPPGGKSFNIVIEAGPPIERPSLTGFLLGVTHTLSISGRGQVSQMRVSTSTEELTLNWESCSWVANLAHHGKSIEVLDLHVGLAHVGGNPVLLSHSLATELNSLIGLHSSPCKVSTSESTEGVRLSFHSAQWDVIHSGYIFDLTVYALQEIGYRGSYTMTLRSAHESLFAL